MPKTVLTFVEDVYEDLELWYPLLRLQESGYATRMAAPEMNSNERIGRLLPTSTKLVRAT